MPLNKETKPDTEHAFTGIKKTLGTITETNVD